MESAQDAVAQAARALRESARSHKKASAHHRKEAKRAMEALENLCHRFGITLKGVEP